MAVHAMCGPTVSLVSLRTGLVAVFGGHYLDLMRRNGRWKWAGAGPDREGTKVAWFRCAGSTQGLAPAVTDELRRRGLHEGPAQTPSEPGITFLGAGSDGSVVPWDECGGRTLAVLLPGTGSDPWLLLQQGAGDVVRMGSEVDVNDLIARVERWAAVDTLVESDAVASVAVGKSSCWLAVLRDVVEAACFTAAPVLVTGETGTCKEVVARLVHDLDRRPRKRELVLLDCTTVVPSLAGSEFFGHERGAFTGALAARSGAFEQAHRGTLFLDEVGELPGSLQSALLRVVQDGTYKRVGGTQWLNTEFRLVAATNRNLHNPDDASPFRRDLYYRIAATTIRLPPLRERQDDIVPLFQHFVSAAGLEIRDPPMTDAVRNLLIGREYPGNVRDLRQLANRVVSRHVGAGPITPGDIPPEDRGHPRSVGMSHQVGGEGADHSEPDAGIPGTVLDSDVGESLGWEDDLRHAVMHALTEGVGLKALKSRVPEVATEVALQLTSGPTAAARLLGVSRRAVDYRKAGTDRHRDSGRNKAVD